MAEDRPPYISFYPSDWKAGTAILPPLAEWTYLQVCLFNWDTGKNMSAKEAPLYLVRNPEWQRDLDLLCELGKVTKTLAGSYYVQRAIRAFQQAEEAYVAKVEGGRAGAKSRWGADLASDSPDRIAEAWNKMADANGLALMLKLTSKRKVALRARIKEYGEDQIMTAIEKVPDRSFLMGKGSRGWKANFDWLLRPDSVAKVMEGQYAHGVGIVGSGLFSAFVDEGG